MEEQGIRLFRVRGDVPAQRRGYLSAACEIAFNSEGYQEFNTKKYMYLARSYYNAEDAARLIADTVEIYRASYKKLGPIE